MNQDLKPGDVIGAYELPPLPPPRLHDIEVKLTFGHSTTLRFAVQSTDGLDGFRRYLGSKVLALGPLAENLGIDPEDPDAQAKAHAIGIKLAEQLKSLFRPKEETPEAQARKEEPAAEPQTFAGAVRRARTSRAKQRNARATKRR